MLSRVFLAINLFIICSSKEPLRFTEDGKFKILQLTDIHYGEKEEFDIKNDIHIQNLIDWEQPDLVVVTGDMVSGYMWDEQEQGWYKRYYEKLIRNFQLKNVKWMTTAGNHDQEADLKRVEVLKLDSSHPNSYTEDANQHMKQPFTYYVPILGYGSTEEQFRVWMLDSGHYYCLGVEGYGCVLQEQLDWLRKEAERIPEEKKGRAILFQHIPIPEYLSLANQNQYRGFHGEDTTCAAVNTGLFAVVKDTNAAKWIFAGHDHDNDYFGEYLGITLGYGRKTGFGQYGPSKMMKGARVFLIKQNGESLETLSRGIQIETWIRQEDGSVDLQENVSRRKADERVQYHCGEIFYVERPNKSKVRFEDL